MSLVRTVIAVCDGKVVDQGWTVPCESRLTLDPNDPQPYIALERAGWATDHLAGLSESPLSAGGGLPTYCPQHKPEPKTVAEVYRDMQAEMSARLTGRADSA